jgi:Ca2+-binding RTX toxin-like protein
VPNGRPVVANLNGDGVTFDAGGAPVRLDALGNVAVSDPDPFGFEVIRVGSGLAGGPLFVLEVPDGSGRMYVVAKNGTITILDPDTGSVAATPFLNVASEISTVGEQGLLGFALAPDFATSGEFYIYMSNLNGDNEVRRYSTLPGTMEQADATSADRILLLPHPNATNHNAGWIGFGPDDMLYIPTGDGAVGANAQSLNSLLGKVLRIDPGSDAFPADPDRDYAIPAGNPYAGATAGLDEIWASGLRNPFRASFDTLTGNMFIGDVGEGLREEIDLAPAGQGGLNYGWNFQEGTRGGDNPAFTRPVAEYSHGTGPFEGNAVTGGLVYRGPIAGLDGHYLFGDYYDEVWSVPVSALVQGATLPSSSFALRNTAFAPNLGTINAISSFATDAVGNLYITDLGGEVFRVQASATPNFAGGSLSVAIGTGEVPGEDRLGFASGAVTLSDGTNVNSRVSVGGVFVGTIAPGGTGAGGEPLVVLFSSGATQARIAMLVQAVTYANDAGAPTSGTRSVTIALNDGAGTGAGGQDTTIVATTVAVSAGAGGELTGTAGNDVLVGGTGGDSLDGLAGADRLVGQGGNDLFHVDNAGDVVVEGVGEGSGDRVFASVSYALGAGVEVERLTTNDNAGTSAIDLTGNALANLIYGNAGANVLDGRGGADALVGFGGDDWYFVDNAADAVNEAAGGGSDRVFASVSYTLGAGVQVERLTTAHNAGTAAIDLTGNALANLIYGNAGANMLDGAGGADALVGFGGDDWYFVDNAADMVNEGAGGGANDRIFASVSYTQGAGVQVERLTTADTNATAAINLTGNELANTIYGNAGANVLDGKAGADALVGLAGADTFRFTTALGGGNIDAIGGYSVADDTIQLDNAVFLGLAPGALGAGAFNTGSAASQADDRVIYNSATGALLFDADGAGGAAAVQFAALAAGLALTASDFVVI